MEFHKQYYYPFDLFKHFFALNSSLYLITIILLLAYLCIDIKVREIGQDVLGTGDDDDTPTGQFSCPLLSVNRP